MYNQKQKGGGQPLGTDEPTKTDVFSEKFQMAFDPPPPLSFSENYIADFFQNSWPKYRL